MGIARRICQLVAALAAAGAVAGEPAPTGPAAGNDLLIVDCLLPGQVRQLGMRSTYVSARQPVRTSARDCRIRGGEYVSHDRADYQTSLAVWLPAARAGDDEARVNVGTIFERGLGRAPDYAAAAHWYRQAAENGHVQAQLRLAHLYEVGLGVPRDPEQSLRWYRQAIGLGDVELNLAPAPQHRLPDQALAALEAELAMLRQENQDLRALLEEARGRLAAGGDDLSDPSPDQQRLQQQVRSLQVNLAERADALQRLEARYRTAHEQYRLAAGERDAAVADVEHLRREREQRSSDAAALALHTATIETLEQRLRQKAREVSEQQSRMRTLQERLAELEQHVRAAAAQQHAVQRAAADGLLAGPSVTMIDPRLPETRGLVQVTVPAAAQQQLIGRVDAPAGLLALTLNGAALETNRSGVFLTEVPVRGATPVTLKAIDTQGKRADLSFELRPRSLQADPPQAPPAGYPDLDLGNFHALVIGNDAYRHLPKLKTAVHDARAVSAVLEQRYGFETRLLIDADRYTILSTLNDYRERLTPDDNLLIYYAGHGELDEVNMRGHWLPVDAEAGSTANWISNVAVTDVLNVMRARHVMLIVDSCYAASLTRSSVANIAAAMTESERRNWIQAMLRKRARLVLSSGGLAPVLDAGGGRHSVFARALLEVLAGNQRLLDGSGLYREVAARVAYAASNVQFEQVPEFGPIRYAGHEAGAFFLVPRRP